MLNNILLVPLWILLIVAVFGDVFLLFMMIEEINNYYDLWYTINRWCHGLFKN